MPTYPVGRQPFAANGVNVTVCLYGDSEGYRIRESSVRNIVVDSGPLIALFDGADQYHDRAVEFVRNLSGRLETPLRLFTSLATATLK